MTSRSTQRVVLLALVGLLALPMAALAQQAITGQVTDNTGGVLPGVTVTVTGDAITGAPPVAFTDGQGQYAIPGLPLGTFSVTFTLPGFSTLVREGIELQAQFTANIDAVMEVGGLEETVTVSGESPVVDVQSAARTEVMTRATIDALPTPRNTQSIGYLAQGVRLTRPDVGGAQMMEQVRMTANGANARHTTMQVDGMVVNSQMADGYIMNYNNQALSQEMAISTSGNQAEVSAGGLRLNMIPKDGGNILSGSAYAGFTHGGWQSDNFTQELQDLGLSSNVGVNNIYDVNPALGGPILRDKLWFFGSFRGISVDELFPDGFIPTFRSDATQGEINDYWRNPSATHPAISSTEDAVLNQYVHSGLFRLTAQLGPRNKVSTYLDRIFKFKDREFTANVEPIRAAGNRDPDHANYHTFQAKWTSTLTNRMLLEVGYSQVYERLLIGYQPSDSIADGGAGVELRHAVPSDLRTCIETPCYWDASYDQTRPWFRDTFVLDLASGIRTNNYWADVWITPSDRFYPNASLSYVTGSHNFKVGMQWSLGNDGDLRDRNGHLGLRPRAGVAEDVTVFNDVSSWNTFVKRDRGIYAQDTWTIDRLTINAGVRWESFKSETNTFRTGDLPAGRFIPARPVRVYDQEPFWDDITPRFSVVYDLFGDSRTALKFSANRFMRPYTSGHAERYSPFREVSDSRDWLDCALDPNVFTPGTPVGCLSGLSPAAQAAALAGVGAPETAAFYTSTDGDGIAQDHEIGLRNNAAVFALGALPAAGARPDLDLQRETNWEYSASIQHEVAPRVSATFAYYRRIFSDIEQRVNAAISSCLTPNSATVGIPCGSWDPFNVAFDDPSGRVAFLNSVGQDITLAPDVGTIVAFNRDPATQGLTDNLDTTSDINRNYYNGFELSMQARLPNGGTVFGGWTIHQNIQDTCGLFLNPNGVSQEDILNDEGDFLRGGRFCDQSAIGMPFRHDLKLFGAYPLPYDFEFSGSIQSYGGAERGMNWTIPSSLYPGGQRTVSSQVQLMVPGTNYLPRWNQVDIALRKIFRFGGWQQSVQMDIYNLTNASTVIAETSTYGSSYGRPTRLLQGRLMRLAYQTSW